MRLPRAQEQAIAVDVFEDRLCAVGLPSRLQHELHAACLELASGPLDVVAPQRNVQQPTGLERISELKEHDARVRARDPELQPALLLIEGLIGDESETQHLGIESERPFLIRHWNTDEFDAAYHAYILDTSAGVCKARADLYYSDMYHTEIDDYIIDVLLRDLTGHDRSPAAFLVYLVLYAQWARSARRAVGVSLQGLAAQTGLSKSSVQAAIRLLRARSLIKVTRESATAVPQYEPIRHWVRRRARAD